MKHTFSSVPATLLFGRNTSRDRIPVFEGCSEVVVLSLDAPIRGAEHVVDFGQNGPLLGSGVKELRPESHIALPPVVERLYTGARSRITLDTRGPRRNDSVAANGRNGGAIIRSASFYLRHFLTTLGTELFGSALPRSLAPRREGRGSVSFSWLRSSSSCRK